MSQVVLARGAAARCPTAPRSVWSETVGQQRIARAARRRRAALSLSVLVLVLAGAWTVRRHRAPAAAVDLVRVAGDRSGTSRAAPPSRSISGPPGRPRTTTGCSRSNERAGSIPCPVRRAARPRRTIGCSVGHRALLPQAGHLRRRAGRPALGRARLRGPGRRRRSRAGDGSGERGGGTVRIAHFGGMVFTHYFHLAAIPRGVRRGARVAAGDVIGLVGDTGVGGEASRPRAHLHFAFSIRPVERAARRSTGIRRR